jgi:YD repeat-containing protein
MLQRRSARVVSAALVVSQILSAVPVAAYDRSTDTLSASAVEEPSTPERVIVNRTVPAVTPPPDRPVFSASPTVEEIFRARVFTEPLVPVGGTPTPQENLALARALVVYHGRVNPGWVEPLGTFLINHPTSPWRASLRVNIAAVLEHAGAFSRAMEAAEDAWRLAKDATDPHGRAVADLAVATWLEIAAMFGQVGLVQRKVEQTAGRDIRGAAGVRVARARETVAMIARRPDRVIASGPEALRIVLRLDDPNAALPAALKTYTPTAAGTSLAELATLAHDAGLRLRVAARVEATSVPIPSVVHWKLGHFSPVVESDATRYRIVDVALGGSRWISRDTLLEENSGYWLIPANADQTGWREVSATEAATVVGHSCPPGGPPPNPPCDNCGGGPTGMAQYQFVAVNAALNLWDAPLGYQPPRGPAVTLRLGYAHRELLQPQILSYANLGPLWSSDWLRFVKEEPQVCAQSCDPAHVWVYLPGGGRDVYTGPDASGVYPAHWRTRATLVRTSTSPLRYERRLTDGTVEVYAQPDGGPAGQQRVFLTQIIDPRGQALTFTWDAQFRLVAVTDAIGQVTTLTYAHATDPLKITKVTDPFGRQAMLTYTPSGQLASITDVIGLTSSFAYNAGDFIAALSTPYGTTTFRHEPQDDFTHRFIEATDPLGQTERLQFDWIHAAIAATAPAADVPAGFTTSNALLDHYNTVYWDKRAWSLGAGDLTKATITRWTTKPEYDSGTTYSSGVPHSIKRPLEGRVWYKYPDQPAPEALGWWTQPTHVARVLDDGSSQIIQMEYNDRGSVLTKTDPLGRRTSYTYAANGTDLLEVRQTTGTLNDLLAQYGDYINYRPGRITDAAGQTTTMTYNAAGQVQTVTNPKLDTTTSAYDAEGRLVSVTGPVTGATTTHTFDGHGRVRTITDSDGYTVTTDYDAFDRPTRVTYPDGTYEAFTYERLDTATSRDRLGRVTRSYYDALRRLVATRDPLGRVIRQEWCGCGSLDGIVDANGNATRWERDVQGRVTREIRANGSATVYAYEVTTSRLKAVTDPKQQVTTYTYALDDVALSTTYTNAQVPTPGVTWTHDANYARVTSMVDGIGTTLYTYHPVGQPGATKVATVDGPLANDTIAYTYDELGRVTNRAINGVGVTWAFDSLGRLTTETNLLGAFTYAYDGVTSRVATVAYPNGQTSTYSYYPNSTDHRLQTIHHTYPAGATLSKFDYTYDAAGNIRTWRQQADTDAVLWEYGYDPTDQLITGVKKATDPQQTVLKRYAYAYDPAGNRTVEQIDNAVTGAAYNSMNRQLSQQPAGPIVVGGTLNEPATVTINGVPASVSAANRFQGTATVSTGTSTFTVQAKDAAGNTTTQAYDVDQAGITKTFTYDANGNLASDGTRTFEWDARNQLVAVNVGTHRSEFTYDGQQRCGLSRRRTASPRRIRE